MKKIISSMLVVGALATSATAYQRAGIDFGFGTNNALSFDLYYKNYNDYDGFVYKGNFKYSKLEQNYWIDKYEWSAMEIGGLFGKAYHLPIGTIDGGLNVLGGGHFQTWKSKWKGSGSVTEYDYSGFGVKGGVNYSAFINEQIMLAGNIFLNIDFGDISGTYLTTSVEGSYKFTPNLYANLKIGYEGTYIDSSGIYLGIGYEF